MKKARNNELSSDMKIKEIINTYLADIELDTQERLIMIFLRSKELSIDGCVLTNPIICKTCGMSLASTKRKINSLTKKGFICREYSRATRTTTFTTLKNETNKGEWQ